MTKLSAIVLAFETLSSSRRSLLLAVGQLGLLAALGANLAWERQTLPRVWAKTVAVDPSLPIRGRYVELSLEARLRGTLDSGRLVVLRVENGELVATRDPHGKRPLGYSAVAAWARDDASGLVTLSSPLAFFISEHARDPTVRALREELWAEVTVPERGPPRPIRLGVKRGGRIEPIE